MKTATLLVLPNPYSALDAEGMPAGAVRYDPEVGRPGVIEYIGVAVSKKPVDDKANLQREKREQRRKTTFRWTPKPVQIPATPYHKDLVRSGQILAADQATARECKIWFVPPKVALEQAKAKAIDEWRATHGQRPPFESWDEAVGPALAAPFAQKPRRVHAEEVN